MKFRKKPVVIDAIQFTNENKDRAFNFVTGNRAADRDPASLEPILRIQTLEGVMTARLGDWIVRGVNGEFYPIKPDIFEKTYDPAEEGPADFASVINRLRAQILVAGEQVKAQHRHPAFATPSSLPSDAAGEMHANITLSYRHLEDARMRLDQAIQAHHAVVSRSDKPTQPPQHRRPLDVVKAGDRVIAYSAGAPTPEVLGRIQEGRTPMNDLEFLPDGPSPGPMSVKSLLALRIVFFAAPDA